MIERDDSQRHVAADTSSGVTRLRACEPCKSRKVRCDKLDPCSACQVSKITCRTAVPLQQRRRAAPALNYDDQLATINEKLSHLQTSINGLSHRDAQAPTPISVSSTSDKNRRITSPSGRGETVASSPAAYLGDSSFEVHSVQTGQILDNVLHNSPAVGPGQDVSSSLQSLRDLFSYKRSHGNSNAAFTTDLSLPPVQTALAALRLVDDLPLGFALCSPFMDGDLFKEICQRVYFPVRGYSMSDFVIVNGGLMGILGMANEEQMRAHNIDPVHGGEVVIMCSSNVSKTIVNLSLFLEPTLENIEAILFGVQISMVASDHSQAWAVVSFAARMCLDSGFNRLKDNAINQQELNRKKVCFWFTYSFDKALSMNFGRTSNFSDYDISVTYPRLTFPHLQSIADLWFDVSRIQGKIYEKLYSAQGQQDAVEVRVANARLLATDLQAVRARLKQILSGMGEKQREPFLDSEVNIIANLTLVYRVLPSHKPAHPLRFSDECTGVAREVLELHQALCAHYLSKSGTQIRMYIDWNLSITPFTPFIVILGTAILDNQPKDMHLLEQVVESLEQAALHAPGVKKLLSTCKILLRGAKSCIEQTQSFPPRPQTANGMSRDVPMPEVMDGENTWMMPQDWTELELDNPDNMMLLFDNYLAGSAGPMPIFETDLSRFDGM